MRLLAERLALPDSLTVVLPSFALSPRVALMLVYQLSHRQTHVSAVVTVYHYSLIIKIMSYSVVNRLFYGTPHGV